MTAQGVPSVEAECPVDEAGIVPALTSAAEAIAGMEQAVEIATAGPDGETEPVLRLPVLVKLCRAVA